MPGRVSMMYEQALDPLKGWFHLSALDKSAKLDADLLAGTDTVPAGRVAVINDNGEFVVDREDASVTNSETAMPIFLWNGSNHPDVYNDGLSATDGTTRNWVAISPTGVMSGLVATGGYELQTTEFDSEQTYLPNDLLTASSGNGDPDLDGILTNQSAVAYTNWICGVASWHVNSQADAAAADGPVGTNAHGVSTLSFWTYFLPEAPAQ